MTSLKCQALIFGNYGFFQAFSLLLFSITELELDTDDDQIKVAYRRLAKFYHPDGLFPYLHWKFFSKFEFCICKLLVK